MKIEKNNINVFLMLWIKNDPDLWSELRDIQIRLLLDRIVKEMSFEEMAFVHQTSEPQIRKIFDAIIVKIARTISKEVAEHLQIINLMIEQRPEKPFSTFEIYLN